MEALFLLIPLSVVAVLALVVLLWWAITTGQFDDCEGPAHQILMDDDTPQRAEQLPPRHKDI
ncbi:MAG: cytochrome oxidase maturation protein, cbb3-type [Betaproteobacteria bacterium RIFCSPLOWO2_12_FULL_62_13]|nr:MAG: cytochrome oxidase maturation protein, cbb3-type [Betaproteobacteria bacterium RIFCSPLOWO2_12_FULL_62_13]